MSVCYASWTRRLAFAHHDAYAVDPTVYAATYTTSKGRLADGTGESTPWSESPQGDEAYLGRDSQPL